MNHQHHPSDAEIVELYFARDEEAIRKTADKYGGYCKSISMSLLQSEPDADECVNDTWLKTWNSIPPKRPSVLRTFLARIVRALSIDRYRRYHTKKYNRDLEVALDELADCSPIEEGSSALGEELREFVDGLEETDRKLFVGRYWYGYPVHRLAEAYGMTPNAVSLRLYRVRGDLRAHLEERGYRI